MSYKEKFLTAGLILNFLLFPEINTTLAMEDETTSLGKFEKLPKEITAHIFSYLPAKQLVMIGSTSKTILDLISRSPECKRIKQQGKTKHTICNTGLKDLHDQATRPNTFASDMLSAHNIEISNIIETDIKDMIEGMSTLPESIDNIMAQAKGYYYLHKSVKNPAEAAEYKKKLIEIYKKYKNSEELYFNRQYSVAGDLRELVGKKDPFA